MSYTIIDKDRRVDIVYILRKLAIERGFVHNKVSFNDMFQSYVLKTGKKPKKNQNKLSWLNDIFESGSCEIMNPNSPYRRNPYKRVYKERLKVNYELAQTKDFYASPQWKALRKKAIKKYGHNCLKCGKYEKSIHVDHILPRSHYPEEALKLRNLQVLCSKCNREKSNKSYSDYREYVAKDGKTAFEQYIYNMNANDAYYIGYGDLRVAAKGKTFTEFYAECNDPFWLLYLYYKITKEDDRAIVGAIAYVIGTILNKLEILGSMAYKESEPFLNSTIKYCDGYISKKDFELLRFVFEKRAKSRDYTKSEAELMLCVTADDHQCLLMCNFKEYLEKRLFANLNMLFDIEEREQIEKCFNYVINNLESMVLYLVKKRLPREMFGFKD